MNEGTIKLFEGVFMCAEKRTFVFSGFHDKLVAEISRVKYEFTKDEVKVFNEFITASNNLVVAVDRFTKGYNEDLKTLKTVIKSFEQPIMDILNSKIYQVA